MGQHALQKAQVKVPPAVPGVGAGEIRNKYVDSLVAGYLQIFAFCVPTSSFYCDYSFNVVWVQFSGVYQTASGYELLGVGIIQSLRLLPVFCFLRVLLFPSPEAASHAAPSGTAFHQACYVLIDEE